MNYRIPEYIEPPTRWKDDDVFLEDLRAFVAKKGTTTEAEFYRLLLAKDAEVDEWNATNYWRRSI